MAMVLIIFDLIHIGESAIQFRLRQRLDMRLALAEKRKDRTKKTSLQLSDVYKEEMEVSTLR